MNAVCWRIAYREQKLQKSRFIDFQQRWIIQEWNYFNGSKKLRGFFSDII